MAVIGIICEYNPFHRGHAAMLQRARQPGDTVVCAMSGNFVQRGESALCGKLARGEKKGLRRLDDGSPTAA